MVLCDLLIALFGVHWVMPAMVRESLLGWKGSILEKEKRRIWKWTVVHFLDDLEGKE